MTLNGGDRLQADESPDLTGTTLKLVLFLYHVGSCGEYIPPRYRYDLIKKIAAVNVQNIFVAYRVLTNILNERAFRHCISTNAESWKYKYPTLTLWSQRLSIRHNMPLSLEQIHIVRDTVPILKEHGCAITTHFYADLLTTHPDLNNIFNHTNQINGQQPKALADSLFAYASHIDDLGVLSPAIERISQKHASLYVCSLFFFSVFLSISLIRWFCVPQRDYLPVWNEIVTQFCRPVGYEP